MMYKTTDSQDLKLEKEDKWVRDWTNSTIASSSLLHLCQGDACGRGFSHTMLPLSISVLVVQQ